MNSTNNNKSTGADGGLMSSSNFIKLREVKTILLILIIVVCYCKFKETNYVFEDYY